MLFCLLGSDQFFPLHIFLSDTSVQYTIHCAPNCTVYVSNCSLGRNQIRSEGGVALGAALAVNQTLQELR